MKKQLFSFLMVLALVVLAGTSAFAQTGLGLVPTDAKEIAIGASATFSVTNNASNTYAWDVFEVASADIQANQGMTLSTSVAATKATIAADNAASTLITFYGANANNNMFVVQCTETDGDNCSTIRRFYVTIFNFDIEVIALGANPGSNPAVPADWATATMDLDNCNTWSGTVVANSTTAPAVDPLDGAAITDPNANYLNFVGGVAKVTETWFAVKITLTSGSLDNFLWRFQYSLPGSELSLYEVSTAEAGVTFGGSGTNTWRATNPNDVLPTPVTWAGATFNSDQTIYIPRRSDGAATATYVFKVVSHNNLGAADMTYAVNIDRVQLEKGDATSPAAYNNGEKFLTVNAAAGQAQLDGTRDVSGTTTIRQSPATPVIGVTE